MQNVRVVSFGVYYAGPLVARHLAGIGCTVTSVVRPEHARGAAAERSHMGAMFEEVRHGTELVVLDLPAQVDDALALVREADVVVENFAPGVVERLGVGHGACEAVRPGLVYLSLPGFANDEYAHVRATEAAIMALSGGFDSGPSRRLLGEEVSLTHLPLASVYASMHAFVAVLVSLLCEHSEHIFVPLASALSETMAHNSLQFAKDKCYMDARRQRLCEGELPISVEELDELFDPFFRVYECRDRRHLYLVCPSHGRHQQRALRALGLHKEASQHLGVVNPYSETPDKGVGCGNLSKAQAAVMYPLMRTAFLTRPAHEWEEIFGATGVPAAMVRTACEWKESAHVRAAGLSDGAHVCTPAWFEDSRVAPEDTTQFREGLHGLKVVDATNVIAGPQIGATLAKYGADVIKVDPPVPTYAPDVAVFYGAICNVGKRSVLLDIHDPRGRDALLHLLRDADVLLLNCTEACLLRLRLTRDDLRSVNPRLILARFDAWSGPLGSGLMGASVGYDDCCQAGLGIMAYFGGSLSTPEEHNCVGLIDVAAGLAGAGAVVAALMRRKRSTRVVTARASLAAVGQLLTLPLSSHPLPPLQCTRAEDGGWTVEGVPIRSLAYMVKTHRVRAVDMEGPTFQYLYLPDHPMCVQMVAFNAVRSSMICSLAYAPKYGAHTYEVLNPIDPTLLLRGVASAAWSREYVPYSAPCDRCHTRGHRRIVLPECNHNVCVPCSRVRLGACAVCGTRYAMDARVRIDRWRSEYASWRRGGANGSRGDLTNLASQKTHTARRTRSDPVNRRRWGEWPVGLRARGAPAGHAGQGDRAPPASPPWADDRC